MIEIRNQKGGDGRLSLLSSFGRKGRLKQVLATFCCGIWLVGCAPKSTYYQSHAEVGNPLAFRTMALHLDLEENDIFIVDTQMDPMERLRSAEAVSMAAANSLAGTSLPQNVSVTEAVAGAAVGTVIGIYIVKAFNESSEKDAANKKAESIERQFSKQAVAGMMRSYIEEAAKAQTFIDFVPLSSADVKFGRACILDVQPELHFNVDLSRLEVKLNASVRDDASRDVLYQNSFEYWSKPIGSFNQCEANCALWLEDAGELLEFYLREGCEESVAMLLYDLQQIAGKKQPVALPMKTHHVTSERSTVFLRSSLVKEMANRVWLKDLRGNVRSIFGRLEGPGVIVNAGLQGS